MAHRKNWFTYQQWPIAYQMVSRFRLRDPASKSDWNSKKGSHARKKNKGWTQVRGAFALPPEEHLYPLCLKIPALGIQGCLDLGPLCVGISQGQMASLRLKQTVLCPLTQHIPFNTGPNWPNIISFWFPICFPHLDVLPSHYMLW
jgi:hypothetical protein